MRTTPTFSKHNLPSTQLSALALIRAGPHPTDRRPPGGLRALHGVDLPLGAHPTYPPPRAHGEGDEGGRGRVDPRGGEEA